MKSLQILNIALWLAVFLYMGRGAWAAAAGAGTRWGDPMRLACLVTAVVFILGFGRLLFMPDNEVLTYTVYVLAAADAVFILRLGHSYGRGKLISNMRRETEDVR